MAFSNATMRRVRPALPHIQFIEGYWRVSPAPKAAYIRHRPMGQRWAKAHEFVAKLNEPILKANFELPPGYYTLTDPVECDYANIQSMESARRVSERELQQRMVVVGTCPIKIEPISCKEFNESGGWWRYT